MVHATSRLEDTLVIVIDAPVSGNMRPISWLSAIAHFFAMNDAVFGVGSGADVCKGSTNEVFDSAEESPAGSDLWS